MRVLEGIELSAVSGGEGFELGSTGWCNPDAFASIYAAILNGSYVAGSYSTSNSGGGAGGGGDGYSSYGGVSTGDQSASLGCNLVGGLVGLGVGTATKSGASGVAASALATEMCEKATAG